MRKILSALMIVTLIVLFAATYLCSRNSEQVFRAQLAELNNRYGAVLQVELLDYQRGLLVSEVRTRLSLPQKVLALQHQIRHFPWQARMLTRLAADAAQENWPEQLQLQTDVSLQGDSQTVLVVPELSFFSGETEVQLKNLQVDCQLDGALSTGRIGAQLADLQMLAPGGAGLSVTGFALESDFSGIQGLPFGRAELRIEQVSWLSGQQPGLARNVSYAVASRLEQELFSSDFDLRLEALELGGETFHDGQLQLQLAGLDAATLRQLQEAARQLQAELLAGRSDPLVVQLQLLGLYSKLLERGLSISLPRVALRTAEGELAGNGRIELRGLASGGGGLAAFGQLDGRFQLDFDQAVFAAGFRMLDELRDPTRKRNLAVLNEQSEQLAGGLVQKGILVRREGGYRLEVAIEQGQAELNGSPFRL